MVESGDNGKGEASPDGPLKATGQAGLDGYVRSLLEDE